MKESRIKESVINIGRFGFESRLYCFNSNFWFHTVFWTFILNLLSIGYVENLSLPKR